MNLPHSERNFIRRIEFQGLISWVYREESITDDFKFFLDAETWPLLKLLHRGYKTDTKKEQTYQCLNQLIKTGLVGHVVADSRNANDKQASKRIKIWDALIEVDLCRACKGSEQSGKTTRYKATSKLLKLKKLWELGLLEILDCVKEPQVNPDEFSLVMFHEGHLDCISGTPLSEIERKKLVPLHKYIKTICEGKDPFSLAIDSFMKDFKKRPIQNYTIDPNIATRALNYIRGMEQTLNEINTVNLNHKWIAYRQDPETGNRYIFGPNPAIKQIHTNSRTLWQEIGLYSWGVLSGQNLSKDIRKTMQIDDEKAAELDSKSHFIRMVYHRHGIDVKEDLYQVAKVFTLYQNSGATPLLRNLIKKITNISLNVNNRKTAAGAIQKFMQEELPGLLISNPGH